MRILGKIIKSICYIILLLIFITILYKIFLKVVLKEQLPTIFGYGSATVISGSMQPNLNIGDYIIVKKEKEYYENDVVVYVDDDNLMVTHRIIEKKGKKFITKGDNNNLEDKPITQNQIKGKVVLVLKGVGTIQIILSEPIPMAIIFFLIITISMTYFRKKDDNNEISN